MASCGGDEKVRLWSRATGEVWDFDHAHAGRVWEIAFTCDGLTIISTSGDETVGIWDVATGKMRARLPGHIDGAKSLTLTRDGKRLITGGLWDGKIRVWRLE